MKKILFNLYIIFGIFSSAFAAIKGTDRYPLKIETTFNERYYDSADDNKCNPTNTTDDDDEYLNINNSVSYEADYNASCEEDVVCAIGTNKIKYDKRTYTNSCFKGSTCMAPCNDNWELVKTIPSCDSMGDANLQKKYKTGDQLVFVNKNDEVILGRIGSDTFFPVSLVNKYSDIKCIGLVCGDGTYGCTTGTACVGPTGKCAEDVPPATQITGLPDMPPVAGDPASHESKAKKWKNKLK